MRAPWLPLTRLGTSVYRGKKFGDFVPIHDIPSWDQSYVKPFVFGVYFDGIVVLGDVSALSVTFWSEFLIEWLRVFCNFQINCKSQRYHCSRYTSRELTTSFPEVPMSDSFFFPSESFFSGRTATQPTGPAVQLASSDGFCAKEQLLTHSDGFRRSRRSWAGRFSQTHGFTTENSIQTALCTGI